MFLIREVTIENKFFKKAIAFLAKYSYGTYLVHIGMFDFVRDYLVRRIGGTFGIFLQYWLYDVFVSLILSIVLTHLVFVPCQKLMGKMVSRGWSH